jgi:hypothetical protein
MWVFRVEWGDEKGEEKRSFKKKWTGFKKAWRE